MSEAAMPGDDQEPRRCPGVNVDGSPCATVPELLMPSGWCFAHDPARGLDRSVAGTLGGIKSNATKRRGLDADRIGELQTPADALRITALLTVASATGALPAPQANAALSAVKAWLAAYEADVLDKRLAAWEAANPEQARR